MFIFKIPAGIKNAKMYIEANGMKINIDLAEAGADKTVMVQWEDGQPVRIISGRKAPPQGVGGGSNRPALRLHNEGEIQ